MFPAIFKSWIYPDGTKSSTKPSDGQVFIQYDKNGKADRVWQWDDSHQQWFDVTTSPPTYQHTYVAPLDFVEVKIELCHTKCECGSEAVGSTRHSTWCAKYSPDI